jgi:hypothetical protein
MLSLLLFYRRRSGGWGGRELSPPAVHIIYESADHFAN